MKFDFTTIWDRKGHDASAIEYVGTALPFPKPGFDPITMGVADMNFATCPTVVSAMAERLEHPLFGYFPKKDEYFDAIIDWHEKRNHVTGLKREDIGYENGVHGANLTALRTLCTRGDKVLLNTPVYMAFLNNLPASGYTAVTSPLIQDEKGVWRMDFEDMERKIIKNNIHTYLFCSPQNPLGRVWERWELEKLMELCVKYDVYVVADEIWCDLTLPGHQHIPLYSISEEARMRTITTCAPSKTFNLAGLVGSYHFVFNKRLRDRMDKEATLTKYNSMNVLSMHALIGAYSPEGHQWVDELRQVLAENQALAYRYVTEKFDGVKAPVPEGTYMMFLDCTEWCGKHNKTLDELIAAGYDVGVYWQDGRPFAAPCHIRINLASPTARVQEAFDRLDKYVFNA